jgi:prepilin-type N-terminal cleavage/methylation domain-containing protein
MYVNIQKKTSNNNGFTLIEILVVMVILILLTYLGISGYYNLRNNVEHDNVVQSVMNLYNTALNDAQVNKKYNDSNMGTYTYKLDITSQDIDYTSNGTPVGKYTPVGNILITGVNNCTEVNITGVTTNISFNQSHTSNICCIKITHTNTNLTRYLQISSVTKDIKLLDGSEESICQ